MPSKQVKVGSVSFTLYPWNHPTGREMWRFAWIDRTGKRRYTTRADKGEALVAARDKAREIHNGTVSLAALTGEQARLVKAFLDLAPTWEHIETLRTLTAGTSITVEAALKEFLATKNANRGLSGKNTTTLRKNLAPFVVAHTGRNLASITKSDLDRWLGEMKKADGESIAPRTRLNLRRSLITLFLWAQKSGYLPPGITAASATEKPITEDKEPLTHSPEEYRAMLLAVRPQYAPWLILGGFMGFRHEELYPEAGSKKPGLTWEDFRWEEKHVIVPKAVSKTIRRIIPIPPAVIRWLANHGYHPAELAGRCCSGKPPAKISHGKESETKRLGKPIGGWRPNALRDSFISYRAAQVGLGQAALEAGNSEAEAKRSYLHAKTKAEAKRYFSIKPEEH